jgi:hypothetical protein
VPRAVAVRRGDVDVPTRPWRAGAPDDIDVSWRFEHPTTCWVRVPQVSRDEAVSIQLTLEEDNGLIS